MVNGFSLIVIVQVVKYACSKCTSCISFHKMHFDSAVKCEQQKMFNDILCGDGKMERRISHLTTLTHIDRHFSLFLSFIKHNHHSCMQVVFKSHLNIAATRRHIDCKITIDRNRKKREKSKQTELEPSSSETSFIVVCRMGWKKE